MELCGEGEGGSDSDVCGPGPADCIDPWLVRSTLCPMCKANVWTGQGITAEEATEGGANHAQGDGAAAGGASDGPVGTAPTLPSSATVTVTHNALQDAVLSSPVQSHAVVIDSNRPDMQSALSAALHVPTTELSPSGAPSTTPEGAASARLPRRSSRPRSAVGADAAPAVGTVRRSSTSTRGVRVAVSGARDSPSHAATPTQRQGEVEDVQL